MLLKYAQVSCSSTVKLVVLRFSIKSSNMDFKKNKYISLKKDFLKIDIQGRFTMRFTVSHESLSRKAVQQNLRQGDML